MTLDQNSDTSYSLEQVFAIIDARVKSNKPLIVTTNLDMTDMEEPKTIEHQRIYDRILEMCAIQIVVDGKSRRMEKAKERREIAKKVLYERKQPQHQNDDENNGVNLI